MKRHVLFAFLLALALALTPMAALASPAGASADNCTYHVVKRGETLSGIALYYGVDMGTLAKQNGIMNPNRIYAGQKLLIRCAPPPQPKPKPTPKPPYYPPPPHPGDPAPGPGPSPACSISPVQGFGRVWYQNPKVQAGLGCPTAPESGFTAMTQRFRNGYAIQDPATGVIYVLFSDGKWAQYPDTWRPGDPVVNPKLRPPHGWYQPEYGIGKLWRNENNLSQRLGWARYPQKQVPATRQPYERGMMIWTQDGGVFVLYDNGMWQHFD